MIIRVWVTTNQGVGKELQFWFGKAIQDWKHLHIRTIKYKDAFDHFLIKHIFSIFLSLIHI